MFAERFPEQLTDFRDVLLAVGRVPNTDDLGLDHAGVKRDERGFVEVDEGLRTTNPRVWALGDCNGKGTFTHTAYNSSCSSGGASPNINVTPLIDVLLVLLIIFMVIAPMLQSGVSVTLPKSKNPDADANTRAQMV